MTGGSSEEPLAAATGAAEGVTRRGGEGIWGRRPGGLREPAGSFGCEWDKGLRGRLNEEARGEA